MSYNSELQSNNTDLQAILETINNLPEAGGSGGGGIETCSVTISWFNDNTYEPFDIYYSDGSGSVCNIKTATAQYNGTLTCVKGSLIYMSTCATASGVQYIQVSSNILFISQMTDPVFGVNGDGTITY